MRLLIIDFPRQADYNVSLLANPMHFFFSPTFLFFAWARLSSCRNEREAFLLAKGHILLIIFSAFTGFIMDWDAFVAFAMGFVVWLGILGIG